MTGDIWNELDGVTEDQKDDGTFADIIIENTEEEDSEKPEEAALEYEPLSEKSVDEQIKEISEEDPTLGDLFNLTKMILDQLHLLTQSMYVIAFDDADKNLDEEGDEPEEEEEEAPAPCRRRSSGVPGRPAKQAPRIKLPKSKRKTKKAANTQKTSGKKKTKAKSKTKKR